MFCGAPVVQRWSGPPKLRPKPDRNSSVSSVVPDSTSTRSPPKLSNASCPPSPTLPSPTSTSHGLWLAEKA